MITARGNNLTKNDEQDLSENFQVPQNVKYIDRKVAGKERGHHHNQHLGGDLAVLNDGISSVFVV